MWFEKKKTLVKCKECGNVNKVSDELIERCPIRGKICWICNVKKEEEKNEIQFKKQRKIDIRKKRIKEKKQKNCKHHKFGEIEEYIGDFGEYKIFFQLCIKCDFIHVLWGETSTLFGSKICKFSPNDSEYKYFMEDLNGYS